MEHLNVRSALASLPDLTKSNSPIDEWAQIEAQTNFFAGQPLSITVNSDIGCKSLNTAGNELKNHDLSLTDSSKKMVGVAGFEPATLWSQTKCASQTALYPDFGEVCKVSCFLFLFSTK